MSEVQKRAGLPVCFFAVLMLCVLALANAGNAEESPLRDAPAIAEPSDVAPPLLNTPSDLRANAGAPSDQSAEQAQAPLAKAGKPVARIPLPPAKPAYLVNRNAPATSDEEQTETQPDTGETQIAAVAPPAALQSVPRNSTIFSSTIFASLPQPGGTSSTSPAPPLAATPQETLPLPPSMRDGQPPEAESDGEEEASLPGGFEKQVDTVELACIKPAVVEIVKRAGQFFRAVPIVTSAFRARGRRGSLHRRCMAVDFVIPGVSTQTLASYLRSQPDAGGVGTYCNTKSVHIDIGEKRNWGYCGFRRTYFSLRQ